MHRRTLRASVLVAVLGAAALTACSEDAEVIAPLAPTDAMFTNYVALGNSITAGYQSGGINDSTQRESYAYLLAQQMGVGDRWTYPALTLPGCPPPVENFQTQARVGGPGAPPCALRTQASAQLALNNVAVPGAWLVDLTAGEGTTNSNALTTFILGGRSQVERALMARPSFVSVWIGNNDVLAAGVSGVLTPMPGVSPGFTPVDQFAADYAETIDALVAGAPGVNGVLLGVVNVTNAPVLFPVQALFNAQFKGGFDQFAGQTTTIHPSCTPTTVALISFQIVSQIRSGAHPPVIACAAGAVPDTPVGNVFVLDEAEIATITQTVAGYNAAIQAEAAERGWAYFDPNPLLQQLRASGDIPAVPNLASPTAPFGAYVSLDGVHPAGPAHVLVANGVIEAINTTYNLNLPLVPTN